MSDLDKQKMELAKATKTLTDNFDPIAYKELYEILSQTYKIKFDAYIRAGFSVDQSLALCQK